MNILQNRIREEGIVKSGSILKVDSFLNHQIDIALLEQLGEEFHRRFAHKPITKVLTLETSGIAVAYPVARAFGVPLLFARKAGSINIDGQTLVAQVEDGTPGHPSHVVVSKKFLTQQDHVLIIDDFLANGFTLQALVALVESAEASVEGLGIVIEKGFLEGGHRMRNLGYDLESLAIIDAMDAATGEI